MDRKITNLNIYDYLIDYTHTSIKHRTSKELILVALPMNFL